MICDYRTKIEFELSNIRAGILKLLDMKGKLKNYR